MQITAESRSGKQMKATLRPLENEELENFNPTNQYVCETEVGNVQIRKERNVWALILSKGQIKDWAGVNIGRTQAAVEIVSEFSKKNLIKIKEESEKRHEQYQKNRTINLKYKTISIDMVEVPVLLVSEIDSDLNDSQLRKLEELRQVLDTQTKHIGMGVKVTYILGSNFSNMQEGDTITLSELWKEYKNEIVENAHENAIKKQKQIAKKDLAEKELKQKRQNAIEKAKETGKKQYIRNVGYYDGDVEKPGQELGIVQINEYATPDGKIIQEEIAAN